MCRQVSEEKIALVEALRAEASAKDASVIEAGHALAAEAEVRRAFAVRAIAFLPYVFVCGSALRE